jgi:hypothetical protein
MIKVKLFSRKKLDITEEFLEAGSEEVRDYIEANIGGALEEIDVLILSTNTNLVVMDGDSLKGVFKDFEFQERGLSWLSFNEEYDNKIWKHLVEALEYSESSNPLYFESLISFVFDEIYLIQTIISSGLPIVLGEK